MGGPFYIHFVLFSVVSVFIIITSSILSVSRFIEGLHFIKTKPAVDILYALNGAGRVNRV